MKKESHKGARRPGTPGNGTDSRGDTQAKSLHWGRSLSKWWWDQVFVCRGCSTQRERKVPLEGWESMGHRKQSPPASSIPWAPRLSLGLGLQFGIVLREAGLGRICHCMGTESSVPCLGWSTVDHPQCLKPKELFAPHAAKPRDVTHTPDNLSGPYLHPMSTSRSQDTVGVKQSKHH